MPSTVSRRCDPTDIIVGLAHALGSMWEHTRTMGWGFLRDEYGEDLIVHKDGCFVCPETLVNNRRMP